MSMIIAIPARLKSSRLDNKLIKEAGGKTILEHTMCSAVKLLKSLPDLCQEIVVAVDHQELLQIVNNFAENNQLPITAVITRQDHNSGSDRIAEAVEKLDKDVDLILNIQADEPDLAIQDTVLMVRNFLSTNCDIATMAYPINNKPDFINPSLVKVVMDKQQRALYFSRSPIPFNREIIGGIGYAYGHVGIYCYRKEALKNFVSLPTGKLEEIEKLEQLRALENNMDIFVWLMNAQPLKGIDTEEDYLKFLDKIQKNNIN